MSFGSGGFGSNPFGSTFKSLPTAPELLYVEFMAADLIRVWFNEDLIVNEEYLNIDNYTILDANSAPLPVMRVAPTNAISLPYILLQTKPQTAGQSYSITVLNVVDRTGVEVNSSFNEGSWTYQRTKGDTIIASMPGMYDTTVPSILRTLLQAIANEDNLIGGAPSGPEEE